MNRKINKGADNNPRSKVQDPFVSLNGSSVLLDSALELLKSDDNNRTRDKYEKPSSIPDVRGLNVKIDLPILKEEKEPSPLASRQEARGINNQLS